jgi:hypothetical protein
MEQNILMKVQNPSAGQDIPCLLKNPKYHYRVLDCCIQNQINPVSKIICFPLLFTTTLSYTRLYFPNNFISYLLVDTNCEAPNYARKMGYQFDTLVSIPGRYKKYFSTPQRRNWLCAPSSLLSTDTAGVKLPGHEADHSPHLVPRSIMVEL